MSFALQYFNLYLNEKAVILLDLSFMLVTSVLWGGLMDWRVKWKRGASGVGRWDHFGVRMWGGWRPGQSCPILLWDVDCLVSSHPLSLTPTASINHPINTPIYQPGPRPSPSALPPATLPSSSFQPHPRLPSGIYIKTCVLFTYSVF